MRQNEVYSEVSKLFSQSSTMPCCQGKLGELSKSIQNKLCSSLCLSVLIVFPCVLYEAYHAFLLVADGSQIA